jgi:ubiquinone biosynthesis protein UbiJ
VNDIDLLYAQFAKWITPVLMAVGGWFCRDMIQAQKGTDEKLHKLQLDLAKHQLDASQTYTTKSELARVHDRIDSLDKKIDDLPHRILALINGK